MCRYAKKDYQPLLAQCSSMKTLQNYLGENRIKEIAKHPRFKILDILHKRINEERKGTKYKPLTVRAIAVKTAHLSLEDLDYLLKRCQQSSNFSKVFFGSLRVRK